MHYTERLRRAYPLLDAGRITYTEYSDDLTPWMDGISVASMEDEVNQRSHELCEKFGFDRQRLANIIYDAAYPESRA